MDLPSHKWAEAPRRVSTQASCLIRLDLDCLDIAVRGRWKNKGALRVCVCVCARLRACVQLANVRVSVAAARLCINNPGYVTTTQQE